MDFFTQSQQFHPSFDWNSFSLPLRPDTQKHVFGVYTQMAKMLAISFAGAYVDMYHVVPGLSGGTLSYLATFITLISFYFTPATSSNDSMRHMLLYGFSFFKGLSLGTLASSVLAVSYNGANLIMTALGATALIFACFSASVLYSRDRTFMYSMGFLSSALSSLFWISLINMFIGSRTLFSIELYLGLLAFSLFVVYDTQIMIARAEAGHKDKLRHALDLYTDFVAMFVRILIILTKKEQEKREDRRRNKNRRD